MNNQYGNVVLLTGASSGIGAATAKLLANNGFHVYGGSRRGGDDSVCGAGFVRMLKLNVNDDASVKEAVHNVIDAEGRIDILINCAGIGICGAIEDCTGADAIAQMDTNYVGSLRMISAVLPHMRRQGSGFIINVGSVGGIYSIPFQTLYSSSKCAVEALTEGLRMEVKRFGIKASLIEPGDVKTGFTAARRYAGGCDKTAYGKAFSDSIATMEHDEQTGMPPLSIANGILSLIKRKNPPVRLVVGVKYKVFVFLKRILPAKAVEAILTMMYAK